MTVNRKRRRTVFMMLLIITAFLLFIIFKKIPQFLYPIKYEEQVFKWSKEFDVKPQLVFGVIKAESNFRPKVVSHADAHGLMQITEDTFEWAKWRMGTDDEFSDIFDIDINIKYGTFILSILLDEFKDETVALAAYNAGRGNALKWLKDKDISYDGKTLHNIPFNETSNYVPRVLENMRTYEKMYPNMF